MNTENKTGRESFISYQSLSGFFRCLTFLPVLGSALLSIVPALLLGCHAPEPATEATFTGTGYEEPVRVAVLTQRKEEIESMDVFVFNNDNLHRLDCYQRFNETEEGIVAIASRKGNKKVAICANSGRERNDWKNINSHKALQEVMADLEEERRDRLFMSAETDITAGNLPGKAVAVHLEKLASEIILRSISCDFTGKPYEGEILKDAKVYLTNVNASCRIMSEGTIAPGRIINAGGLNQSDLEKFTDPGLVFRRIGRDIGPDIYKADISLLCYPNCGTRESPGTPFTRLVIEGKIGNDTWYWPVDINRSADANGRNGIERNCQYVYDIRITRKGSSDPDTPAKSEDIDIKFEIRKWDRKEEYAVHF